MTYLQVNYLQAYTKLRAQQTSFHEFMELINKVYEFGHQRGELHGIQRCREDIEAQVKARALNESSDAKDAARYRYLRELLRTDSVKAQAFFWNSRSRKKLDEDIDAAIRGQQ